MTLSDEVWLRRALELARRAAPALVEPNPPVGAVIAKGDSLLGEGYHRRFGGPHAEIEAFQSVKETDFLSEATLYVTLEPCCHTSKKTPPCVPAIIAAGIRRVVVGMLDPNPAVAGGGVAALRAAGIEVALAPDSRPFRALLRHYLVNLRYKRPYITLKWAQTAPGELHARQGYMGSSIQGRWAISSFWGRVWGHRLRATHSHIAVGYRTWLLDQPALTTRLFPGESPHILIFYDPRRGTPSEADERFFPLRAPLSLAMQELYQKYQVGSLLVEGGADTLQRFLAAGLYDEIHVLIRRTADIPPAPVMAPSLPSLRWRRRFIAPDEVLWYAHQ